MVVLYIGFTLDIAQAYKKFVHKGPLLLRSGVLCGKERNLAQFRIPGAIVPIPQCPWLRLRPIHVSVRHTHIVNIILPGAYLEEGGGFVLWM